MTATASASKAIATALLTLNDQFICRQARMINGRFMITMRKARVKFVFSCINNEMPITPPSINHLVLKNLSIQNRRPTHRQEEKRYHERHVKSFSFPVLLV